MSEPRTLYKIGFINDPSSPDTLRWMIDHGVLVPVMVDDLNLDAVAKWLIGSTSLLAGMDEARHHARIILRAALGGTDEARQAHLETIHPDPCRYETEYKP